MSRKTISISMLALIVGVVVVGSALTPAKAAEGKQYMTTTIRGRLTYPDSGQPMVGATLRFTPTDPSLPVVSALTDEEGAFAAEGLGFGIYAVELETETGEVIRGINAFSVQEGKTEVVFKFSDRVRSSTRLENEPERFMAAVDVQPRKWKKFWKEFALFFGIAAASGAGAF